MNKHIALKSLKRYSKPKDIIGVYILFEKDKIVYIGQSTQIIARIISYAKYKQIRRNFKSKFMLWDSYTYIEIKDKLQRLSIEAILICKHKPKYNFVGE